MKTPLGKPGGVGLGENAGIRSAFSGERLFHHEINPEISFLSGQNKPEAGLYSCEPPFF